MNQFNSAATATAHRIWLVALGAAAMLLLLSGAVRAQQPHPKAEPALSVVPDAEALRSKSVTVDAHPTGCILEVMPTFQGGGLTRVLAYMQKQLRWPAEAHTLSQGRVFATFTVDSTGQVQNARIVKGLHPLLDAEVLRVISELTGFTPAKQGNKPVSMELTIPIEFKIR